MNDGPPERSHRWPVAALLTLMIAFALPLAPAGAAGTVRSVAPWGSDAAAGTEAAPFRTIGHSIKALRPGDTLVVRGGTYDERIKSPSITPGTTSAPVSVVAKSGERPVLRGLLWLSGASHWSIRGLNVTWSNLNNSSEHMVKLTGGTGWSFSDAEVWDARSYAAILVVGSPSNWRLSGLHVHDTHPSNSTNQDHLIYVNGGTGGGVIERNLLVGSTNGRAVKLGPPSSGSGVTENVVVRYNTMSDNRGPSNVQFAWESSRNLVERNIMVSPGVNRSAVTTFDLTGTSNVVRDNIAFDAVRVLDSGVTGLVDGGGNLMRNPRFVDAANGDFRTTEPLVAGYGRFAGATATAPGPTTTTTAAPTPTTTTTAAPRPTTTTTTTAAPRPTTTTTTAPRPTTTTTTAPSASGEEIVLRGSTFGANATSTSISLARPVGTQVGDLLLTTVDTRGKPTLTAPDGWNLVRSDVLSTTMVKATYSRLASGSDPTMWTWRLSTVEAASGAMLAFDGVDPALPLLASAGLTASPSKAIVAPSVHLPVRSRLVTLYASGYDTSISMPTGIRDLGGAISAASTYKVTSRVGMSDTLPAGSSGTWTATTASTSASVAHTLALRPAR